MTTVYFATNRKKDGSGKFGYGAQIVAASPDAVTYAVCEVSNVSLGDESSGTLSNPTDISPGNFSDSARRDIVAAGKNLFVFIHGFDNSFEDAIQRAAFNHEWIKAAGAQADTIVIAFTWPSAGVLVDNPPHMLTDAYLTDQTQAARSGFHIASFLSNIDTLQRAFRAAHPNGKVFLLAHSMGNWALQSAVQTWSEERIGDDLMFDEVFLAAADEVADTFERPAGGRLSNLKRLAKRITIYSNRADVVIWVSTTINMNRRLGYDGPDDESNAAEYPPALFRLVDCTDVNDYDRTMPFDASHQYYRRSQTVRNDIVAAILGKNIQGGIITLE
ncbi:MAG TPA: alpha/beta fold hydrolase [Rhizomicrobium sp.]|nr:alpha/beta fold hydrolase [Rhizomicrobium sp.]